MKLDEKRKLITRNLQEVLGGKELEKILKKGNLQVYWGTAPTGKPHVGYFVPMFKIRDLLNAGCKVTILFADLHAYLDNMKSSWEQLAYRTKYYEFIISEMLKAVGADLTQLRFVKGSDFQLKEAYTRDMFKLSAQVNMAEAKKAGAEVVKQVDAPKLSGLLYPLLQALDEEHLKVDAQFGGVDQRKIFVFAQEFLPKIGYKKRIHLMNPLVSSLSGEKMSSSEEHLKVDLLDDPKMVKKKLNKGFCKEGDLDNFFMDFLRLVTFPLLEEKDASFTITRPEKFGGDLAYTHFAELKKDFVAKKLHPLDVKNAVAVFINDLVEPIRKAAGAKDVQELLKQAY